MKNLNIKQYFFIMDGKKEILNTKMIKFISIGLFLIFSVTQLLWTEDYTGLSKSNSGFTDASNSSELKANQTSKRANEVINTHQAKFEQEQRLKQGKVSRHPSVPQNVNFNAAQVITRSGLGGTMKALPSGSNFIGQLLNGIDTRNQNQIIKVLLPYGARHRSGGTIPKNTTILGIVSYNGQGEKVYITFNRAIFPDGKEYKISAQALTSKDYAPGLLGDFHGNAELRIAATMGLTLVSAASRVLTSKSSIAGINQNGQTTVVPDATMRNALLEGVSKVSGKEAERQAQELEGQEEFVTVDAGSDLIVSLLTPFNGEEL